jgi:hypothetical protein
MTESEQTQFENALKHSNFRSEFWNGHHYLVLSERIVLRVERDYSGKGSTIKVSFRKRSDHKNVLRINGKVLERTHEDGIEAALEEAISFYGNHKENVDTATSKSPLVQRLERVPGFEDNDFLQSLRDQAHKKGSLSEKQMKAFERIEMEREFAVNPETVATRQDVIESLQDSPKLNANWTQNFLEAMIDILESEKPYLNDKQKTVIKEKMKLAGMELSEWPEPEQQS